MSASAWSYAPLPCEDDKGWQAGLAGNRLAVLPGLWDDAAGLIPHHKRPRHFDSVTIYPA